MNDLMRLPKESNSSFTAWKVKIGRSEEDQERLVQTLKQFRSTRKRVIVDCHPLTLISLLNTVQSNITSLLSICYATVLFQMKDLQMLTEYHHYIFTSFVSSSLFLPNSTWCKLISEPRWPLVKLNIKGS